MADKIGEPLGLSVEEAAFSVKETIDEGMGRELGIIRKKLDNVTRCWWCTGERGPAHCCRTAKVAGIKKIVITPFSAVFFAYSSSGMDVGHIYYAHIDIPFSEKADFSGLPLSWNL